MRHGGKRVAVCLHRWDIPCAESAEWQAQAGVDRLPDGADQPFYHVLVDVRDWPDGQSVEPHVTYVAEELLIAPQVTRPVGVMQESYTGVEHSIRPGRWAR